MLLQVHDELIFEVDIGTEAAAMPVIQRDHGRRRRTRR